MIVMLFAASEFRICAQTVRTLFSFNGANGAFPETALTLGNDGGFYGTTPAGGITNAQNSSGMGTVFKITTNGILWG